MRLAGSPPELTFPLPSLPYDSPQEAPAQELTKREREPERVQQQHPTSACHAGSAQAPSVHHAAGPIASARARVPASSYGSNSEVAELSYQVARAATGPAYATVDSPIPTESALRRQEALWKTLAASGIVPTDG